MRRVPLIAKLKTKKQCHKVEAAKLLKTLILVAKDLVFNDAIVPLCEGRGWRSPCEPAAARPALRSSQRSGWWRLSALQNLEAGAENFHFHSQARYKKQIEFWKGSIIVLHRVPMVFDLDLCTYTYYNFCTYSHAIL